MSSSSGHYYSFRHREILEGNRNTPIETVFNDLRASLNYQSAKSDTLSTKVEAIRAALRPLQFHFAKVHTTAPWKLAELLSLENVDWSPLVAAVQALGIDNGTIAYHKVCGVWAEPLQQAMALVMMQFWVTKWAAARSSSSKDIEPGQLLADPGHVSSFFGVSLSHLIGGVGTEEEAEESALSDSRGFHISIQNYLHAALLLCSELARLAFNSVTTAAQSKAKAKANSDSSEQENTFSPFELPVLINQFLKEVQAAFMSLNLQNDSLRRRYDALKYDVKSVEQIVYDLTLRGLV